jgi:hypothetical protein
VQNAHNLKDPDPVSCYPNQPELYPLPTKIKYERVNGALRDNYVSLSIMKMSQKRNSVSFRFGTHQNNLVQGKHRFADQFSQVVLVSPHLFLTHFIACNFTPHCKAGLLYRRSCWFPKLLLFVLIAAFKYQKRTEYQFGSTSWPGHEPSFST